MNIGIFYYDGFAEFEVAVAAVILRKESIFAASLEKREYKSEEMQRFIPDKQIHEMDPDNIDLFIIPGGDPRPLYENKELRDFLWSLNQKGKKIAGICGGAELLAAYGLLDNRRCTGDGEGFKLDDTNRHYYEKAIIVNEGVVEDGNIITSMGRAFVDFGVKLGNVMGVIPAEDIPAEVKWLKNL